MRHRLSEKSALTLHMLHMLRVLHVSGVCRKKKIFGVKATGSNSFHRCGGPPPSRREVWGLRRSRPPALPSIGYRGFAVAPYDPSRARSKGCYNIGDKRARDARPYRGRRCNRRLQMHLTVAMMQPSVANPSHSCNFPQRCRGAHRAPADILQTLDFPSPRPPSSREGDRPQRWKEFAAVEGVKKSPFQTSYASYASYARHTSGT